MIANFEDAYLPSLEVSVKDFSVGMYKEKIDFLLAEKEINIDYVKYAGCYFFRDCEGKSVIVDCGLYDDVKGDWQVIDVSAIVVTKLPTTKDMEEIEKASANQAMTMAEIVEKIGLPAFFQYDFKTSSIPPLIFHLADGTTCQVYLIPQYSQSPFQLYKVNPIFKYGSC